jgi:serine protease Do
MAEHFKYKGAGGALVDDIVPDGPAAKAKVEAGDIITQFNGKPIRTYEELRSLVAATEPGKTAKLTIWRDGKESTLDIPVGRLAEAAAAQQAPDWLGLKVDPLTDEQKREFNRPDLKGVVVSEVADDGAASGLVEEGDVIMSVNRVPVNSTADYQRAIAQANPQRGVVMRVLSPNTGYTRFVVIRGR